MIEENLVRNIFYYKNYYIDFFNSLNETVRKKFNWTLKLIATLDRVPAKFFKHIEGSTGLYEIRLDVSRKIKTRILR